MSADMVNVFESYNRAVCTPAILHMKHFEEFIIKNENFNGMST